MPLFTFSYCLICFKKDTSSDNPENNQASRQSESSESFAVLNQFLAYRKEKLSQKREICRRFGTLASRYLKIDPFHYNPDKTLYSKHGINLDHVCDVCMPALKSFCEMYESWTYLQLQMDHRLFEISELMKVGDRENTQFKDALNESLNTCGEAPDEVDNFREEFISKASKRKKGAFPRLPMLIEKMDEDPDFVKLEDVKQEALDEIARKLTVTAEPKSPSSVSSSKSKTLKKEVKKVPKKSKKRSPEITKANETAPLKQDKKVASSHFDSDSDESDLFVPIYIGNRQGKNKLQPSSVAGASSTSSSKFDLASKITEALCRQPIRQRGDSKSTVIVTGSGEEDANNDTDAVLRNKKRRSRSTSRPSVKPVRKGRPRKAESVVPVKRRNLRRS